MKLFINAALIGLPLAALLTLDARPLFIWLLVLSHLQDLRGTRRRWV